jgi:hypothetical protein
MYTLMARLSRLFFGGESYPEYMCPRGFSLVGTTLMVIDKICLHYILLVEILRLCLRSAQNDILLLSP